MTEWFYESMGEEFGPFTGKEFKDMAERGALVPDSLIRKGTTGSWVTADRVKGLFAPKKSGASSTATKRRMPELPEQAGTSQSQQPETQNGKRIIPKSKLPTAVIGAFLIMLMGSVAFWGTRSKDLGESAVGDSNSDNVSSVVASESPESGDGMPTPPVANPNADKRYVPTRRYFRINGQDVDLIGNPNHMVEFLSREGSFVQWRTMKMDGADWYISDSADVDEIVMMIKGPTAGLRFRIQTFSETYVLLSFAVMWKATWAAASGNPSPSSAEKALTWFNNHLKAAAVDDQMTIMDGTMISISRHGNDIIISCTAVTVQD